MKQPNPNEPFYAVIYDDLRHRYRSNNVITSFEECLDEVQSLADLTQSDEAPYPYVIQTWADVVNFCEAYDYHITPLTKEQLYTFIEIPYRNAGGNRLSFTQSQQFDRYLMRTS